MAKKKKDKMVNCRYPKCHFLHETTELKKDDAVQGGKQKHYYHPDCYHTMQTINKIRDTFYKEINPMMTGSQVGTLVSIVNNMVFSKHIDVDYILFALQYFITNKPGVLKYPGGIAYIVQDREVESAWKAVKEREVRQHLKEQMQKAVDELGEILDSDIELDFGTEDSKFVYKQDNKSRFSKVLGV